MIILCLLTSWLESDRIETDIFIPWLPFGDFFVWTCWGNPRSSGLSLHFPHQNWSIYGFTPTFQTHPTLKLAYILYSRVVSFMLVAGYRSHWFPLVSIAWGRAPWHEQKGLSLERTGVGRWDPRFGWRRARRGLDSGGHSSLKAGDPPFENLGIKKGSVATTGFWDMKPESLDQWQYWCVFLRVWRSTW